MESSLNLTKDNKVNKWKYPAKVYSNIISNKWTTTTVTKSKDRVEMIYQKYRDNSQEHEEVNRILGVLQRNLDRNPGGQFGLPPSSKDPKRNQIRMLLDKHLQMKDEAKDFSQSMVFSPEKKKHFFQSSCLVKIKKCSKD